MPRRVLVGGIPTSLMHFRRRPGPAYRRWDDLEDEHGKIEVEPSFVVDATSEKARKTAQEWATTRTYDSGTGVAGGGRGVAPTVHSPHRVFLSDNRPIPSVRIITLEERAEGGRAYKVLTPVPARVLGEDYPLCRDCADRDGVCHDGIACGVPRHPPDGVPPGYVDLREDVLLDALLNCGCKPGGVLEGPFIWARVHTQMKLVRVGSDLHKALIEADARGKSDPLKASDLVPGGVYLNRKCEASLYLGQADTDEWIIQAQGWTRPPPFGEAPQERELKSTWHRRKGMQLWIPLSTWRAGDPDEKILEEARDAILRLRPQFADRKYTRVEHIKARTVFRHVGDVEVPVNIHERVRTWALGEIEHYRTDPGMGQPTAERRAGNLAHFSASAFTRPPGEDRPVHLVYAGHGPT